MSIFPTIDLAMACAQDGDTIMLDEGTYTGNFTIDNNIIDGSFRHEIA